MAHRKHSINCYVTAVAVMPRARGKDSSDAHKQRPSRGEPAMPTWGSSCGPNGCHAMQPRPRPRAPAIFIAHPSTTLPKGPRDLGTRVPPGPRRPQVTTNLSFLKLDLGFPRNVRIPMATSSLQRVGGLQTGVLTAS